MTKSKETIIQDVRVCLDRNWQFDQLLEEEDVDTLSLNELIESKIEEGVTRVEMAAPVFLVSCGKLIRSAISWKENPDGLTYNGSIVLPDDFMRLLAFEMSDWNMCVHEAIESSDEAYLMQRQGVTGLRGNVDRPVCALSWYNYGRVLEFYSSNSQEAYVKRGFYRAKPKIDLDGMITVSERCYEGSVYMISALVLASLSEGEGSELMMKMAEGALQ